MARARRGRCAALVGVALTGAVLASACGGGGSEAAPSTLPTLPPSFASTTARTTVPASTSSTSTTVPVVAWPLTGLPGGDAPHAALPALVVKIDNHPRARPQVGLIHADVVIEEIVEGITRFFAIYHSTGSDPVGPIRSARTTDIDLLRGLNRPLFAWSGGNNGVLRALREADVATDVGYAFRSREAGYYRDPNRRAPHNLFATTTNLWALTPDGAQPPAPMFRYRPEGTPGAGGPVAGAKVTMAGTRVLWQWDATSGAWIRSQDDEVHTDASGTVIAPSNVVIMFVEYVRSPADPISPEAVTVGEGEAIVLTAGGAIGARWVRPDPSQPARLVDAAGADVLLTPGRTWVELARPGRAALVPAGTDPAAVAYPSA